jgi:hypothetical protein
MAPKICPSCGHDKGLRADGSCKNKAACLRRATSTMVTKPYIGDFDPVQAYFDSPKGAA